MSGRDPWDVVLAFVLIGSVTTYTLGVARAWRHAAVGRGIRRSHVLSFGLGATALVVALLSPLDALSDVLFSAHMGQHELLILVAAPLLVLGKPGLSSLWAMPSALRSRAAAAIAASPVRTSWRVISAPGISLGLHVLVLWLWHLPGPFQAALGSESIHAFQHVTLFLTAALFWWGVSQGRYGRAGYGAAALFVFVNSIQGGILAALLTVAQRAWYPVHAVRTAAAGHDPLSDQQLAGLIMWVPAGAISVLLGLALFAAWLGYAARRRAAAERANYGDGPYRQLPGTEVRERREV